MRPSCCTQAQLDDVLANNALKQLMPHKPAMLNTRLLTLGSKSNATAGYRINACTWPTTHPRAFSVKHLQSILSQSLLSLTYRHNCTLRLANNAPTSGFCRTPAMLNLAVQGWDAAFLGTCCFQPLLKPKFWLFVCLQCSTWQSKAGMLLS